jgi:methyl-accepting chemotaxis protein
VVNECDEESIKVHKALNSIKSIASQVDSIKCVTGALNECVVNFFNVLAVIQSVADQTNLLDHNAAIEAARVGEKGFGFAVVTDKVIALIKRVRSSTTEIAMIIVASQTDSKQTIMGMTEVNKRPNKQ